MFWIEIKKFFCDWWLTFVFAVAGLVFSFFAILSICKGANNGKIWFFALSAFVCFYGSGMSNPFLSRNCK